MADGNEFVRLDRDSFNEMCDTENALSKRVAELERENEEGTDALIAASEREEELDAIVEDRDRDLARLRADLDQAERALTAAGNARTELLTRDLAAERSLEETRGALAALLDWFYEQPGEGKIAAYDRWAMEFYRETGIWPPGKSAPLEMHHDLSPEERSHQYRQWQDARRQELESRARRALASEPAPATREHDRIGALEEVALAACRMRACWDDATCNPLAVAIAGLKMTGWAEPAQPPWPTSPVPEAPPALGKCDDKPIAHFPGPQCQNWRPLKPGESFTSDYCEPAAGTGRGGQE
jgi:hypothetical protein